MKKPDEPAPVHAIFLQVPRVYVCLFTSKDEHLRYVNTHRSHELLSPKVLEHCVGICSSNHLNTEIYIGVFNGCAATLVHECTHAALRAMEMIGEPLQYGSEILPYTIELLYKEFSYYLHGKNVKARSTRGSRSLSPRT